MSKRKNGPKISFREATKGMTAAEIAEYRYKLSSDHNDELMASRDERCGLIHDLYSKLFSEQYDVINDSLVEARERKKGINPMRQEYIDKVNQKRLNLGVSPLGINGTEKDNSAYKFCEAVAKCVSDKGLINIIDVVAADKGNEELIAMLREEQPIIGVVNQISQIDAINQPFFRLINFLSNKHT